MRDNGFGDAGQGMRVTRIDSDTGEIVALEMIKPDVLARIEMLGKLNDEMLRLLQCCNYDGLLKLAQTYYDMNMPTMAKIIRKKAKEITYEYVTPETHTTPAGRRKAARGVRKAARSVQPGAVGTVGAGVRKSEQNCD